MQNILDWIRKVDKKKRNIVILIVLWCILTLIIASDTSSKPVLRKSKRVLMCNDCKYTDLMEYSSLEDTICPKCGKKDMGYCMKCAKCQYEFPYRPYLEHIIRCPNCDSFDVFPVPNSTWAKRTAAEK